MKKVYVVRYRKAGKLKDSVFETEKEAKEFYQERRKYLDQAILFTARDETVLERLSEAKVKWLGMEADLTYLAIVVTALVVLWGLFLVYNWRLHE